MDIFKTVEISAQSENGIEDAIEHGIARACKHLDNVQSAWLKDQEVSVKDGHIKTWRVRLKVTFKLK